MKSSNNDKMGDFERNWREAFEGTELTPSSELWTGIQGNLANKEVAGYRKRLVFYRWAAAIALLLLVGVSWYSFVQPKATLADGNEPSSQSVERPTEVTVPGPEQIQANKITEPLSEKEGAQPTENLGSELEHSDQTDYQRPAIGDLTENLTAIPKEAPAPGAAPGKEQNQTRESEGTGQEKSLAGQPIGIDKIANGTTDLQDHLTKSETNGLTGDVAGKDPAANQIEGANALVAANDAAGRRATESHPSIFGYGLAYLDGLGLRSDRPVAYLPSLDYIYSVPIVSLDRAVNKEDKPKLWAGLSFAPGTFDPNYQRQNAETQLVAASAANTRSSFIVKEDSDPGFSMAMGVDFGMDISKRWKVKSGLQYFNNSVQGSTNAVLQKSNTPVYSAASYDLATEANQDGGRYLFLPDTDLNSTFEFLSIPVEAGYVVLNKKVQVVVNAGVGTNIFLQNKIEDKANNLTDVTITPGDKAPFKSLYFNGLVGIEGLYNFTDHLKVSLKPQYRVALSEFTKSNSDFTSYPSAFGVSLGIQYYIK